MRVIFIIAMHLAQKFILKTFSSDYKKNLINLSKIHESWKFLIPQGIFISRTTKVVIYSCYFSNGTEKKLEDKKLLFPCFKKVSSRESRNELLPWSSTISSRNIKSERSMSEKNFFLRVCKGLRFISNTGEGILATNFIAAMFLTNLLCKVHNTSQNA